MKNTSAPAQTAQIFIFPFRERVAAMATADQKFAAMEATAGRFSRAVVGDGWYHDEAIRDAGQPQSN